LLVSLLVYGAVSVGVSCRMFLCFGHVVSCVWVVVCGVVVTVFAQFSVN
jgi:hypothetical protein